MQRGQTGRRGAAMMMVLFVIFIAGAMVLNVLQTEVVQLSVARNVADHERALYLAQAGVHEACAMLELDLSWRDPVGDSGYPADDTYRATLADGLTGQVVVTSVGVSGGATRTVEATVQL